MNCQIIPQDGTGTSYLLQPMFDRWARSAGVAHLFPGTVYLGADSPVRFPDTSIDLGAFVTDSVRSTRFSRQANFSPRLHPISVGDALLAWAFRWYAGDEPPGKATQFDGFNTDQILEVITTVHVKGALGAGAVVEVAFLHGRR